MARILVVDDEKDIAELVEAVLVSEGYEVKTANSGREALASINGKPLHLVLLDVMMPDIDGCTVLKELKADAKTRGIPVVLMSANGRLDAIAAELRAEGKLHKPFSVDDLLGCVARLVLAEDAELSVPV